VTAALTKCGHPKRSAMTPTRWMRACDASSSRSGREKT